MREWNSSQSDGREFSSHPGSDAIVRPSGSGFAGVQQQPASHVQTRGRRERLVWRRPNSWQHAVPFFSYSRGTGASWWTTARGMGQKNKLVYTSHHSPRGPHSLAVVCRHSKQKRTVFRKILFCIPTQDDQSCCHISRYVQVQFSRGRFNPAWPVIRVVPTTHKLALLSDYCGLPRLEGHGKQKDTQQCRTTTIVTFCAAEMQQLYWCGSFACPSVCPRSNPGPLSDPKHLCDIIRTQLPARFSNCQLHWAPTQLVVAPHLGGAKAP